MQTFCAASLMLAVGAWTVLDAVVAAQDARTVEAATDAAPAAADETAQRATKKPSADESDIRASAAAFVEAFNAGDAEAIAKLWTVDGEYVDQLGQRVEGREAIGRKYADFFSARPDAKMAIEINAVRMLGPRAAMEEGIAALTVGDDSAPSRARYVAIHVKQGSGWRMASVRDVVMPAQAGDGLQALDWLVGRWSAEHAGAQADVDSKWIAERQYLERRFTTRRGDKVVATSTEIVGWCPIRRQIESWTFTSNGGRAHGLWVQDGTAWVVEATGVAANGSLTTAVNVWRPLEDGAIGWRSVGRSYDGIALGNARDLVLQRKSPSGDPDN